MVCFQGMCECAVPTKIITWDSYFQGIDCKSWDCLYNSVIKDFINKNLLKQLTGDLLFQVFCIKKLLK